MICEDALWIQQSAESAAFEDYDEEDDELSQNEPVPFFDQKLQHSHAGLHNSVGSLLGSVAKSTGRRLRKASSLKNLFSDNDRVRISRAAKQCEEIMNDISEESECSIEIIHAENTSLEDTSESTELGSSIISDMAERSLHRSRGFVAEDLPSDFPGLLMPIEFYAQSREISKRNILHQSSPKGSHLLQGKEEKSCRFLRVASTAG